MRRDAQESSENGSPPETTMLGRKRSIGRGFSSLLFRSASDDSLVRRKGAPSGKFISNPPGRKSLTRVLEWPAAIRTSRQPMPEERAEPIIRLAPLGGRHDRVTPNGDMQSFARWRSRLQADGRHAGCLQFQCPVRLRNSHERHFRVGTLGQKHSFTIDKHPLAIPDGSTRPHFKRIHLDSMTDLIG